MELPLIRETADGPAVESASPELLANLLDEYEYESRIYSGPVERALAGISREEVVDSFAQVGLVPPEELVVLFGWHNGVRIGGTSPFPRLWFTPLAELVGNYESRLRLFEQFDDEDLRFATWGAGPGWFPLVPGQYTLAVDCTRAPDLAPRVRSTDIEFDDNQKPMRRGQIVSLCTLVTWWIEGIRSGAHRWDSFTQTWSTEDALLPELQRQTGVV